jgi:hypothetical protein
MSGVRRFLLANENKNVMTEKIKRLKPKARPVQEAKRKEVKSI